MERRRMVRVKVGVWMSQGSGKRLAWGAGLPPMGEGYGEDKRSAPDAHMLVNALRSMDFFAEFDEYEIAS
jgi:hypothetical protein